MLFPQPMIRLVWFLPVERLAYGLQLLANTGNFHMSAQYVLGEQQDVDTIKQSMTAQQQRVQNRAINQQLSLLPEDTLLNYQVSAQNSDADLFEDTLGYYESPNLTISANSDSISPSFFSRPQPVRDQDQQIQEAPELSPQLYQLIVDTADRIGSVGEWRIIDGWIPAYTQSQFSALLDTEVLWLIPAEETGLKPASIPSMFKRSRRLAGFADLMGLYDTTAYRELDPTPLLAIGFSLMFGIMFADLGQGLLLFLTGFWLSHFNVPKIEATFGEKLGWLLMPVGLSASLFGVLFGSLFSREDWIPALLFHPMDNVIIYLLSSVVLGMTMILGAMLLGLFNACRGKRISESLWSNFGPFGLLFYIAIILFALSQVTDMTPLTQVSAMLAAGSLFIMFCHYFIAMESESAGIRLLSAFLESYDFVMKFIMQTFSFVRVAAFTFAHIALSTTLIIFVDMSANLPWLAVFIFVLGNILITLVEGILVAIQAVRLHFFELFTKFVAGGGVPFVPLRKVDIYAEQSG